MEGAGDNAPQPTTVTKMTMDDLQHDRTPPEVLISYLYRRTTSGEPGAMPARPTGAASLLTGRELDVLDGLATGVSDREIALRLMLFEPVVRAMRQSIDRKLGVRRRGEAAVYAASRTES
jgi:DNA-binding NarL/FixJ family response regulator